MRAYGILFKAIKKCFQKELDISFERSCKCYQLIDLTYQTRCTMICKICKRANDQPEPDVSLCK